MARFWSEWQHYTLRMKDQIYNTFVVDNKNCNELYCIEISMNEVNYNDHIPLMKDISL